MTFVNCISCAGKPLREQCQSCLQNRVSIESHEATIRRMEEEGRKLQVMLEDERRLVATQKHRIKRLLHRLKVLDAVKLVLRGC